jgi:isopentenyl diphosphate isomerase/L-lactate dehydrogenase-like FMN-dependent dehydrogenase
VAEAIRAGLPGDSNAAVEVLTQQIEVLVDVAARTTATTILGDAVPVPLALGPIGLGGMMRGDGEPHTPITAPRGPTADAVTALLKLGYSEGQAAEAVSRAANDLGDAAETSALLREALRGMGR